MKPTTARLAAFISAAAAVFVSAAAPPRCPDAINAHGQCFNLPAVVSENYKPKGIYRKFAGMNTYVTGDERSKKAVFFIHDIFGQQWKTLQGADLIASAGYLVVLPDFFFGQPMDVNMFPPQTPEQSAAAQAWLSGPIPQLSGALNNTRMVLPVIKAHYRKTKRWGSIGLCWGTKPVTLLSQANSLFDLTCSCHPSGLDPKDAPGLTVPHLMLASSGENATDVQAFKEILETHPVELVRKRSYVETYSTMPHGWMGGKADLVDPNARSEYQRGYRKVVEYLWKTL